MFNGIQNNSFGFNKSIVATDINGTQVEVASCYTSLTIGDTKQSIAVNISIDKPKIVAQHMVAIQNQFESFFDMVNGMATQNDMPLIQPTPRVDKPKEVDKGALVK